MLAIADLARGGVDLGDGGEERAGGEALVHNALVLVVVEDEDGGEEEKAGEDEDGDGAEDRIAEQVVTLRCGARTVFDFDGQGVFRLDA